MGKIIDLYANRKFLEQARALGLTYSAYYDLVIEKGIHIEVALENAKRGITLENYLSMQNQTSYPSRFKGAGFILWGIRK